MVFGGASSGGELWIVYSSRESKIVSCTFTGKISQGSFEDLLSACEDSCQQMFNVVEAFVTNFYKSTTIGEEQLMLDSGELVTSVDM